MQLGPAHIPPLQIGLCSGHAVSLSHCLRSLHRCGRRSSKQRISPGQHSSLPPPPVAAMPPVTSHRSYSSQSAPMISAQPPDAQATIPTRAVAADAFTAFELAIAVQRRALASAWSRSCPAEVAAQKEPWNTLQSPAEAMTSADRPRPSRCRRGSSAAPPRPLPVPETSAAPRQDRLRCPGAAEHARSASLPRTGRCDFETTPESSAQFWI